MDSMILSYLSNIAFGSLIFLALVLAIISAARTMAASTRYWILIGAILGIFALPILSAIMPSWRLPIPGSILKTPEVEFRAIRSNNTENGPTGPVDLPVAHKKPATVSSEQNKGLNKLGLILSLYNSILPYSLLSIWFIGVSLIGTRNYIRWRRARLLVSDSRIADDSRLVEMAAAVKEEFGINRPLILLINSKYPLVMVWGFLKPRIILPDDYRGWSNDKLKAVLNHEMAHIARYDNFFIILTLIVSGLYWFNPLIWVLIRKLNLVREASCDDYVLSKGVKSSDYAAYLMEILQRGNGIKKAVISPVMATYTSNIKRRLNHVLNDQIKRKTIRLSAAYLIVIFTLCMVLPISAVSVWSYTGRDSEAQDKANKIASSEQKRKKALLEDLKHYEKAAAEALSKRESSLLKALNQHESAQVSAMAEQESRLAEAIRQYEVAKALALSEEKAGLSENIRNAENSLKLAQAEEASLSEAVQHYENALALLAEAGEDSNAVETRISNKLDSLSRNTGLFSAQHYKELKKQGPPSDLDLIKGIAGLAGGNAYRYYSDGSYSYEDDGSIVLEDAAIYDDTKDWKFEANDVTLYQEDGDIIWLMEAPKGYIKVTVKVDGIQLKYKVSDFALEKSMFMKRREFYIDDKPYPFGAQQMEEFKLIVNEVFELIDW